MLLPKYTTLSTFSEEAPLSYLAFLGRPLTKQLKRLDRKEVPLFHIENVSPAFLFSFCRQETYIFLLLLK